MTDLQLSTFMLAYFVLMSKAQELEERIRARLRRWLSER